MSHFDDIEKDLEIEETVNMRELGMIAFPEADEITAKRKASVAFKRACEQLGIDPESFKPGKEYAIPKSSLTMWILLLKNINAVEGNPSKKGYINFVGDVIQAKAEIDNQFNDMNNSEADLETFQQSMTSIYELFYTSTTHGKSIAMLLHNELLETIQEDIKFILEEAPADCTVIYTEFYYNAIKHKTEEMGKSIRKMVNEKWNEQ